MAFKPGNSNIHPGLGISILLTQFTLLLYQISEINTIILLLALLTTSSFEIIITRNSKNCLNLLRGILPLLIITTFFSLFFSGPLRAVTLILRLITGSLIFSIFILTTNPSDLSKFLEKLHIPLKLAIIPGLSLSLIPRTLKDIEDTYNTLFLRGEIEGSFLSWLPKLLAISISSTLYRSNFIAESLFIRGFTSRKRKRLGTNHKIAKNDFFKFIYWFLVFLIIGYWLIQVL